MPSPVAILENGQMIMPVHFAVKVPCIPPPDVPQYVVACAPQADLQKIVGYPFHPWHRSDDIRAVTCPECKKSAVYEAAIAHTVVESMLPVVIRVLPDEQGNVHEGCRVRIHWYNRNDKNPTPTVSQAGVFARAKGRIACMPQSEGMHIRLPDGRLQIVHHSDDPRAVTCPECVATPEFKEAMNVINGVVNPLTAEVQKQIAGQKPSGPGG